MPLFDGRPEPQEVVKLAVHLRKLWSQAHGGMTDTDTYLHGTYPVWATDRDTRPKYRPAIARSTVEHAVDTMMSVDPTVHKIPAGEGPEQAKRADAAEVGLHAVMMDAALKEPVIPTRQFYKHLICYGYATMGVLWEEPPGDKAKPRRRSGENNEDYDARVDSWQKQGERWNPIRWVAPHPADVLMDPLESEPSIAIMDDTRYEGELEDLTIAKGRYKSKWVQPYQVTEDPYHLVKVLECWTDQWHLLTLQNGQGIFIERTSWGFQPWTHAFSGWGIKRTQQEFDPGMWAVGMLDWAKETIRRKAQQRSAIHNAVIQRGFARQGTRQSADEVADSLSQPEAVLEGEKEDYWWLEYPEIREWVFRAEADTDREFEQATYMRAIAGERQEGVTTVGQQQILSHAAGRKFFVLQKQTERVAGIIAERILRMVVRRGHAISVGGETLKPLDIEDSYGVTVTFKQVDPLLRNDNKRIGMEEFKQGLISDETYRQNYAELEDEQEERKRLLKQRARQTPELLTEMGLAVLRLEGMSALADRLEQEARERAAAQAAGGNGRGVGQEEASAGA